MADVDRDGVIDLVVGFSFGGGACFAASTGPTHAPRASKAPGAAPIYPGLSVLRGRGDGTFDADPLFVSDEPGQPADVVDFNDDGWVDIVAVNAIGYSPQLCVFLGNQHGSYGGGQEVPLEQAPQHVVVSNFDGDKLQDVAVACWGSGTVDVLLGKSDSNLGPFVSSPTGYHPAFLAAGDFDQDGHKDLAVANFGDADTSGLPPQTGAVTILHGNGDGSFRQSATYPMPGSMNIVRAGDLDRDGRLDLVATSYSPIFVDVLLGNGDGTFRPQPSLAIPGVRLVGMTLSDFDQDGKLDIAFATVDFENAGIRLLKGNGDGTFATWTSIPLYASPLEAANLNLDEFPDLIGPYPGPFDVKLGNGDGTFRDLGSPSVGATAVSILATDLNGDGLADIASVNPYDRICSVYVGLGTGEFTRRVDYAVGTGLTASIAAGDLNGDGRLDLAVANSGSNSVSILWNEGDTSPPLPAHAFLSGGASAISAATAGPATCFQLEPLHGSYNNSRVDLASVYLESGGTGSVKRIPALPEAIFIESDQDGDGVVELPVCFSSADIGRLFSNVRGLKSENVTLAGHLQSGEPFQADLIVRVVGASEGLRAYVVGSPSASSAMLFTSTSTFGQLTARLYDVRGRLVRTIVDEPFASPGLHTGKIDGTGNSKLPSGVYFYRVESVDGTRSGRVAILH